jgi:hypothetical protein
MSFAPAYSGRCWAEPRPNDEISNEIERCKRLMYRDRGWQEVGSAEYDHLRIEELQRILDERAASGLTAFEITRSDGTSYVTSMAAAVTLDQARNYSMGRRQYHADDAGSETYVVVVDVKRA